MIASRTFDERCQEEIDAGESFPHFHAGIGQEALSVSPVHALEDGDNLLYTHRGYGQLIARGISMETILKDMLYRATGSNGGFGGVLHLNDPERGLPGRNGVFGTRFTIASGLGTAKQIRGEASAVLCYYGEAAGARGPLFEALNLMSLWDLPVVLVAENNGYSISSRTEDLYAPGDMSTFAEGFDVDREVVDGNDPDEVFTSVDDALRKARQGGGPTLVEGMTYRIPPHVPSDSGEYRSEEEIEEARRKDPIPSYTEQLIEDGVVTEEDVEDMHEEMDRKVTRAIETARADREPTPEEAMDFVYYEGVTER